MSEKDPQPSETLTIVNLEIEDDNSSQDNVTKNNDENNENIPDQSSEVCNQEGDSVTSPGSPSLIVNTNDGPSDEITQPLQKISTEEEIDKTGQDKSLLEQELEEKPNGDDQTTNQDNKDVSLISDQVSDRKEDTDMSVDESPNIEKTQSVQSDKEKEDTSEPTNSVKNPKETVKNVTSTEEIQVSKQLNADPIQKNVSIEKDVDMTDSTSETKVIESPKPMFKTPIKIKNGDTANSCEINNEQKKVNVSPATSASAINAKKKLLNIYHLHTLKLFGLEYQMGLKEARKYFMQLLKDAALPPVVFGVKDREKAERCKTIYTSNWPTWLTPEVIKLVARWFTDLNFDQVDCFIEVLTYKDVTKGIGAALIHFDKAEDCMYYFQQLKNITWFNKNVAVDLDLDNKIKATLIGQYIYCTHVISKPTTEDRWLDPEITQPYRTRISLTSLEAPLDYRADPMPSDKPRLSFTDEQQRLDMLVILRVLGLPFGAIEKVKAIIKESTADKEILVPKTSFAHNIVISNVATWFQDLHFIYLLEIFLTETDLAKTPYFVEILQYSNGVNKGAALVRFTNPVTCLAVYKQLKRIELLNTNKKKSICVNLDTAGKVAKQIITSPTLANWKDLNTPRVFCSRYVLTREDMPESHTLDKPPRLQLLKKKLSEKTLKNQEENASAAKKPKISEPDNTAPANAVKKPELSEPTNSAPANAARKTAASEPTKTADSNVAKRAKQAQSDDSVPISAAKKPKLSEHDNTAQTTTPVVEVEKNNETKNKTNQPPSENTEIEKETQLPQDVDMETNTKETKKVAAETTRTKEAEVIAIQTISTKETEQVAKQIAIIKESEVAKHTANAKETGKIDTQAASTTKSEETPKQTASTKETEVIAKPTACTKKSEEIPKQTASPKEPEIIAKQTASTKNSEEIPKQTEIPKEPEKITKQTASAKESEEIAKQTASVKKSEEIAKQSPSTKESEQKAKQTASTTKSEETAKKTASDKKSEGIDKQTAINKGSQQKAKQAASTKESEEISKPIASATKPEEKAKQTARAKKSEEKAKQTTSANESEEVPKQTATSKESEETAKQTASTKESEEIDKQTASTKESEETANLTASSKESDEMDKEIDFLIKDEDMVDISDDESELSKEVSEEPNVTLKETPTKSTDVTSSLRKDMRIIHLKNLPPGQMVGVVRSLLKKFTKFNPDIKPFFMRKLCGVDEFTSGECLLKFETPVEASMVARSLVGVNLKEHDIQAELKSTKYATRRFFIKRKLKSDSTDDDMNTEDTLVASFENEWEYVTPKRGFLACPPKTEETFGINPAILARLGVKKMLCSLIIVINLHEEVTEAKLHEIFSLAGRITNLRTTYKFNNKRSRIEYEHPVEALQAVSMFNGQKLYGVPMRVFIANENNGKLLPAGLEGIGKGFGPKGLPLTAVQTHVFTRKLYELFQRMGYVDKIRDDYHPFQGYFEVKPPHLLPPPFANQQRNDWSGSKPTLGNAIEALGTVLLALDLIPPDTELKNLQSIIHGLQQHPKVKQHLNSKNRQRNNFPQNQNTSQGTNPTDQNSQAEAFYQSFCTYMQNMGYGGNFPQMSYVGDNTGQNQFNMLASNYMNMTAAQQNQNMPSHAVGMNANLQSTAVGMANYGVAVPGMNQNVQNTGYVYANMNQSVATPIVASPTIQRAPIINAPVTNTNVAPVNVGHPNLNQNQAQKNLLEAPSPPKWNDGNNSQRSPAQSSSGKRASTSKSATRSQYDHGDEGGSRDSRGKSKDRDSYTFDMLQFKNLPPSVTPKALIRKMEEVGEIVFAEMTGKGRALVRFKKVDDAARCQRLFHRSKVDGHVVEVTPV